MSPFIVLSDLLSDLLDVRVKGGAELSTDYLVVICFLRLSETLVKQEIQQIVCDLPDEMGGFGGQGSNETVCIQYII